MADVALVMPKMSMTMTEGEVLIWHRSEGDEVRSGDVIAEVMTDKVDMEVEAPVDGVLLRIVADAGTTVPVGEAMAYIESETSDDLLGGMTSDAPAKAPSAGAESAGAESAAAPPAPVPVPQRATPPSRQGPVPALPGARRRAAELGVGLHRLAGAGTGPSGAVSVADVERLAAGNGKAAGPEPRTEPASPPESPATPEAAIPEATAPEAAIPEPTEAPEAFADALAPRRALIRKRVAEVMTRSAAIPQFTVWRVLDLEAADARRDGVSWTAVLVAALARALRGTLDQTDVAVAVAADTPVGLLAPVVRDADTRSAAELERDIRDLVGRARAGRLRGADLEGATTTLSNLGRWDVSRFSALLTPPQATALSTGAVARTVVARDGAIALRLTCEVGLTVDHTQADGADAARVLAAMDEQLRRGDLRATGN